MNQSVVRSTETAGIAAAPFESRNEDARRPRKPSSRRIIIAASAGNALEWYDFTVYALFAIYIGQNFFRNENPAVQLMSSFLAFGLGYVARPLGALILGTYADHAGRKAALTATIFLMAAGTLLIAAAPPYAALGIGGPLLIVCGRVLQGFSAGGEISSATAFLTEHAPAGQKGKYGSWLQASMGISNVLGALVATVVTALLSKEQIGEWGWRIPFIIGLAIVPVGLWMRSTLEETPLFTQEQQRSAIAGKKRGENSRDKITAPLRQVLTHHSKQLLTGLGLSTLWAAGPYALIIYMPVYVQNSLKFSSTQSFTAAFIGSLFLIAACPFFGVLSDRWGRQRVLRLGATALLVLSYPALALLGKSHTTGTLIAVQAFLCFLVASYVAVAPTALSEIFPTKVRSSGMSISYNLAVTVLGGFAPAILTWITYATGVAYAPALYVMGAAVVALISISFLPKHSEL